MNQDESMFALLTKEEFDQIENQFKLFRGDTVVNNRRPTPSVTQKSTKSSQAFSPTFFFTKTFKIR